MRTADRIPVVLATLTALSGCAAEEPPPEPPLRPVRTTVAELSQGGRDRSFSGVARAATESKLSFRVSGTLETLAVQVGSRVEGGDEIATLDPSDFELNLEKAQAALDQAEAQRLKTKADYDRDAALYENEGISKQQLDASRTAWKSASASVESNKKQVELARRSLHYTNLIAPESGFIAEVPVEINENVNAGQPIVLLTAGQALEIHVGVPEGMIARVAPGQAVDTRFNAFPDQSFKGTVREVGIASTTDSTTFPVTVKLDEVDRRMRPGMAVDVVFTFNAPERIHLPTVAVGEDRDGRFVFVVQDRGDGKTAEVKRRTVETGDLTSRGVEVLAGVQAGDIVVTAGVTKIADGMVVRYP